MTQVWIQTNSGSNGRAKIGQISHRFGKNSHKIIQKAKIHTSVFQSIFVDFLITLIIFIILKDLGQICVNFSIFVWTSRLTILIDLFFDLFTLSLWKFELTMNDPFPINIHWYFYVLCRAQQSRSWYILTTAQYEANKLNRMYGSIILIRLCVEFHFRHIYNRGKILT